MPCRIYSCPSSSRARSIGSHRPFICCPWYALGFYIAANGTYHTQLSIIRDIIDKWITTVSSSHLNNSQRWTAFRTFLYPRITYPLQLAAIPTTQLLKLDQKLAPYVLQSLNLNQHFPVHSATALYHSGVLLSLTAPHTTSVTAPTSFSTSYLSTTIQAATSEPLSIGLSLRKFSIAGT